MKEYKICLSHRILFLIISSIIVIYLSSFTHWGWDRQSFVNDIIKVCVIAGLIGLNLGINFKKIRLDKLWELENEERKELKRQESATKLILG